MDYEKALQVLRDSEGRFRMLADTAPVMLWMAGKESLTDYFNKTWLDFRGRTMEQEAGTGWQAGVHRDDFDRCRHTYLGSFHARQPYRMEYRLQRHDGEYRWLLSSGVPRYTVDQEFTGYVGSCVDITELKQAEQLQRRQAEELARSNAELERFVHISSHDLQEPLRMISNYTQLLAKRYKGKLDADADQFIGYATEGADRIRELIDDLLQYSYIGKSQVLQTFHTVEAVNRAVKHHAETIDQLRAGIEIAELPLIHADPDQIYLIFQHLLENAIKYRSASPLIVRIYHSRLDDELIFSVEDNGIGIEPRFQDRIFEVFSRLHSRAAYPGTGVGLAIARRVIERHGGRIWVESRAGQGARFRFSLPAISTTPLPVSES